jgi:phospholipase C
VIFQENVAVLYFVTYPNAANPAGEPHFSHSLNTPSINGLATAALLNTNTNLANPFRLDRSQAVTVASCNPAINTHYIRNLLTVVLWTNSFRTLDYRHRNCDPKLVMAYFDGESN